MNSKFAVDGNEHVVDISDVDMYIKGEKQNAVIVSITEVRDFSWAVAKWGYIELAVTIVFLIIALVMGWTFTAGGMVAFTIYALFNLGKDVDVKFDISPNTVDEILKEDE